MSDLDLKRIRKELAKSYAEIQYVEQTGSTNTDLMQVSNVVDSTVLLTNSQTQGKGRLGRVWVAPTGTQVTFSVLLLPSSVEHVGTLPLAAGLAVTDAIEGTVLKWPNDVLLNGKKLGGILAEAGPVGTAFKSPETNTAADSTEVTKTEISKAQLSAASSAAARVVLGMGINVTLTADQLPVPTATSLLIEGLIQGTGGERTEVAISVLTHLRKRITQWENQDPQLMTDYRRVCSSIGRHVRLEAPTGDIHGVVEGVADDGRINVGGNYYSAGDVIHLRPA